MAKIEKHKKKFISENHLVIYEGSGNPRYIGRSCLDSWVLKNGGKIEISKDSWIGEIEIDGVLYSINLKYTKHRALRKSRSLKHSIETGDTIYCDEILEVKYNGNEISPILVDALTGNQHLGGLGFRGLN